MVKNWLHQFNLLSRQKGFWIIAALFVLISLPYYDENLSHPGFLMNIMTRLGLGRHYFERILYLAPILWSGFLYNRRAVVITSSVALALMLPGAFFNSENPVEAILESIAIFVVGNIVGQYVELLRREREKTAQLEGIQRDLTISEQRYRELFENAHDAIWLHDLTGRIINANRASERLTGYPVPELINMDVRGFLSPESMVLAGQVRDKMLNNQYLEQPYEQRIKRKDDKEAIIQLATSLVMANDKPVAFQHIARDVTEQTRLQENQAFYLQQVAKAQEEERKRISRELHDETIQSLVVLSRQLDALATTDRGVSPELRFHLEELWQQTNNIMNDVRRLSQDLRPPTLDRLGLFAAIHVLVADVARYSGLEIKVNLNGTPRRLPEEVELILFRITQESLRNVWRHAHAKKAEVNVNFLTDKVLITVMDNGKGFALPKSMSDLPRDGKLGLAGMQERARLIGAELNVESTPNIGTTITISLATEVPVRYAPATQTPATLN